MIFSVIIMMIIGFGIIWGGVVICIKKVMDKVLF